MGKNALFNLETAENNEKSVAVVSIACNNTT
jgi:hypothetical protein